MAALEAEQPPLVVVALALAAGTAAMFGIHWLMHQMYRLGEDGTVQIERSVGRSGTVYIPIPAARAGAGKVQLQVQGRIMEYQAVTSHPDKLSTGAKVVVVGVVSPTTVEVELAQETAHV